MYDEVRKSPPQCDDVFLTKAKVWSKFVELSYRLGLIQIPSEFLKAVYILYHRSALFRSARKNYFNFEVTKNFVEKFKAHFEK